MKMMISLGRPSLSQIGIHAARIVDMVEVGVMCKYFVLLVVAHEWWGSGGSASGWPHLFHLINKCLHECRWPVINSPSWHIPHTCIYYNLIWLWRCARIVYYFGNRSKPLIIWSVCILLIRLPSLPQHSARHPRSPLHSKGTICRRKSAIRLSGRLEETVALHVSL